MSNNFVESYEEIKSEPPVSEQLPLNINELTEHIFNYQTGDKLIKKNTVKKYLTDIHIIRKLYDSNLSPNNFEFLTDFKNVLDIIRDKYSTINSISTIVNSISSILKRIPMYTYIYDNIYKQLNDLIAKEKQRQIIDSENKLTEKEKSKFVDWDTILSIEDNIQDPEDKLLFYLYTQIPPRRIDDYSHIILINDEEQDDNKQNFVIVKSGSVSKIILNHYKTFPTYGKYIMTDIPKKLNNAIINHIQNNKITNNDFIFKTGRNNFSKKVSSLFKKYLDIPINVNILRHSFITHILKKNLSTKKKQLIANQMGHNMMMQDLYRREND